MSLTASDRDRIHQLAGRGLGCYVIGKELGKHPSTVQWFMYREGLAKPGRRNRYRSYKRNGRSVHPFTEGEDLLIVDLRLAGKTPGEIASALNEKFGTRRTRHTVRVRLTILACLED